MEHPNAGEGLSKSRCSQVPRTMIPKYKQKWLESTRMILLCFSRMEKFSISIFCKDDPCAVYHCGVAQENLLCKWQALMAKEQYFGMLFMLSWGGSHGFVESRFENSQQPRLCRPHKTNLTPKNWGGLSLKMNSFLGLAIGNPCLTLKLPEACSCTHTHKFPFHLSTKSVYSPSLHEALACACADAMLMRLRLNWCRGCSEELPCGLTMVTLLQLEGPGNLGDWVALMSSHVLLNSLYLWCDMIPYIYLHDSVWAGWKMCSKEKKQWVTLRPWASPSHTVHPISVQHMVRSMYHLRTDMR